MTERLALLLREESDALDVPAPDPHRILAAGRARQHRRRVLGATVAATTVLGAVGLAGITSQLLGDGSPDTYATAPELQGWAAASGSTVELGNGRTVHVDGTVKSVYYTSAGVLVRTGRSATTDAPDSAYTLVPDDGTTSDFSLDLGDRVPGTDPDEPYLAYAEPTGDPARWDVVLRDVRSGQVAASVPVEGRFTWGGWVAPPVSLDGDRVYVGMDAATLVVDWRSGAVTTSDVLPPSRMPTVQGGRGVLENRSGGSRVVDVGTAEVLLRVADPDVIVSLAPDGRHAMALPWRTCDEDGTCTYDRPTAQVYDVDRGTHVRVDLTDASYGWTPRGDLLRVDRDSVDVCSPDTGTCRSTPVEVGGRDLRLGGTSYEA